MYCKNCHSTIVEFIMHEGQNPKGRVFRRLECDICGPLHYKTLLPLKGEADEADGPVEAKAEHNNEGR